jgi:hypothetical protein
VRLGRRRRTGGGERSRRRPAVAPLAAAVVVVTLAGTVVVAGEPAGSAEDDRRRNRNRNEQRNTRRQPGSTEPAPGPTRFLAEVAGRIAVVAAETGRVGEPLTADQPGGGARDPALSPDGRTVWFSRGDGSCAAHIASVPVAGGDEKPLPGSGEVGPERMPLPRPGRDQLAYARADCPETVPVLMVGDLAGVEGHGQRGLVPQAWNRHGTHLLATTADGQELRLLGINEAGGVVTNEKVAPADSQDGCIVRVIGFSPDDNDGYVAVRRCGPSGEAGSRSLVLLDKNGGLRRTVVRLSRGHLFVDHVAFDATGHALLYSTAAVAAADGAGTADREVTLWLWRDGQTRRLARQSPYRHPVWLP